MGAAPPSFEVGSSGSKRGAASSLGLRSRLCSSRSKSAIRWGIVLGTSDRVASSRATAAWISLIIRCLRAECRVSPVPCLRAMRAPRARRMSDTTPDIAFSFRNRNAGTLNPVGLFSVTPTRATQRAPRGPAPQQLLSKGRTCIASAVVAAHRPSGVAVACQRLPTRPKGQRDPRTNSAITCGPAAPEPRAAA